MVNFTRKIAPAPIHGVSKQKPELMLPGQCELQDNYWVSLNDISTKRYPTEHKFMAFSDHAGPLLCFGYDRSPTQQYGFIVSDGEVRAYDLYKDRYLPVVLKPSTGPTDFSYLESFNTETYPIAGSAILSGAATSGGAKGGSATGKTVGTSSGTGPWGGTKTLGTLSCNAGVSFWFAFMSAASGGDKFKLGWNTVSFFWKYGGSGANFGIGIYDDTAGAMVAQVKWTAAADSLTAQTISVGTAANTYALATQQGGQWWKIQLSFKVTTQVGNSFSFGPYIDTGSATNQHIVYGIRYNLGKAAENFIVPPREAISALPVYNQIYLLNRTKTTALGSTTPTIPKQIAVTLSGVPADNAKVIVTPTGGTAKNIIFLAGGTTDSSPNYYINTTTANTKQLCAEMLAQKITLATGLIAVPSIPTSGDPIVNIFYYDTVNTVTESGDSTTKISIAAAAEFFEIMVWIKTAGYNSNVGIKFKQGVNFVKAATVTSAANNSNSGAIKSVFYTPDATSFTQANCEETAGVQDYNKGVFFNTNDAALLTDITTDGMALDLAYKNFGSAQKQKGIRTQFIQGTGFAATNTVLCVNSCIRITSLTAFDEVQVTDSFGGEGIIKVEAAVEDTADFPPTAAHGWRIIVKNNPASEEDDYWVKAVTTAGFGFSKVPRWDETTAPSVVLNIDKTTMPVVLTIKRDNDAGAVTTIPYQDYFEYDYGSWQDRAVGDNTSNPQNSFIGNAIRAISGSRARLDLGSQNKLIASEINNFWNFWLTRISVKLDGDPIDDSNQSPTSCNHIKPSNINHLVPFKNKLYLFTDPAIFAAIGDPILSAKTIQIKPVQDIEVLPNCVPVPAEGSMFIAKTQGDYSSILEMFTTEDFDSERIIDQTRAVKGYIPGKIFQMAVCPQESILFAFSDSSTNTFYCYKWDGDGNQRLMSSVFSMSLATNATILGGFCIKSELYLVVSRPYGVFIEKMRLGQRLLDPNSMPIIRLDRRMSQDTPGMLVSYDGGTGNTTFDFSSTITAPAGVTAQPVNLVNSAIELLEVWKKSDLTQLTVVSRTNQTVVVSGDQSLVPVWIGLPYRSQYRPMRAEILESSGRTQGASTVAVVNSRIAFKYIIIGFSETGAPLAANGPLTIQITRRTATGTEVDATQPKLDSISIARYGKLLEYTSPQLWRGTWFAPVSGNSEETIVDIISDSALPHTLTTIEFSGEVNPQEMRMQ